MVLIIGVTGSIAAGKSHLCGFLAEHYGALHLDADKEAHQLYAPGTPGFERVVAAFGEDVVGADGVIDRKVLGAKVFGNADRMQALRDAMGDIQGHFMAILESWRTTLPANGMALLESVNLLENGYMSKCDAGWLVVCERETAIARLTRDRGLTEAEAEQRLASARDWRERSHLADQVIHNDGTVEELLAATRSIADEAIELYRSGTLPRPRWYESQDAHTTG